MKRLQQTAKLVDTRITSSTKNSSSTSARASSTSSGKSNMRPVSFLSLDKSIHDATVRVYQDEHFVCIRDKFPKAATHLLLIPYDLQKSESKLHKVEDIIRMPNGLSFLRLVAKTCQHIIDTIVRPTATKNSGAQFKCGFHAIQSMNPLHLHIISEDFDSPCLKNKKHWNSFTTAYFIDLDAMISHLDELEKSKSDYFSTDKFNLKDKTLLDNYLKQDLKCHKCAFQPNNLPALKSHVKSHQK